MQKHLAVLIGCGLVGLSGVALAGHNEPVKATRLLGKLVTAYSQCTAPNDTWGFVLFPACHPTVRSDAGCGYDPANSNASGQMNLIVNGREGVRISARVKGLAAGCEGEQLHAVIDVRISSHDCASADPLGCTTVDLPNYPLSAGCIVIGGECTIHSITDAFSLLVDAGKENGYELLGFGLQRFTSVNSGAPTGRTFSGGIFFP
jgi:hypothetical protein